MKRSLAKAFRCTMCSINYPPVKRFYECPVCGSGTFQLFRAGPDADYIEQGVAIVKEMYGSIPDTPEEDLRTF